MGRTGNQPRESGSWRPYVLHWIATQLLLEAGSFRRVVETSGAASVGVVAEEVAVTVAVASSTVVGANT